MTSFDGNGQIVLAGSRDQRHLSERDEGDVGSAARIQRMTLSDEVRERVGPLNGHRSGHERHVFIVSGEDAAGHADDGPRLVINGAFEDHVGAGVDCSARHRTAGVQVTILSVT